MGEIVETKLSNPYFIIVIILISYTGISQSYTNSEIGIEQLSLNGIGLISQSLTEQTLMDHFGTPLERRITPPQIEWDDGGKIIFYQKNTRFNYSKYGQDYYLESVTINAQNFRVLVGDNEIAIGKSLIEIGAIFEDSFRKFKHTYSKPYAESVQNLFVSIIHNMEDGNYYTTSLKLVFRDDKLISFNINLVEGG